MNFLPGSTVVRLPKWLLLEPTVVITHEGALPGRWTVCLNDRHAGYGPSIAAAAKQADSVRRADRRNQHSEVSNQKSKP